MALRGSPQRNLHQFILWKVAPSRMLALQDQEWLQIWWKVLLCTPPGWWTAQQKGLKRMVTKVQWLCWKLHDNWELRISGYGAAEVYNDFAEELKHTEANPMCSIHVIPKFETKILRSDIFAQVILISTTPTLQNLRIGLKKRRNGKSDVPVKQRGSWPKAS